MLQCTSNQRWPGRLIPTTPPLAAHNHPHGVVSQHLSSLINTTELLVQEFPSICLPACLPLSAFLLFLPSSSCFPLSRIHLRQGARARLLKSSGWKCDNNTTKTKMPGQERRESARMKNAKSTFRLVGVQWSPRGPSVVNNRQEVKMQDEGRVCVW